MVKNESHSQRGSALIALLIAALIIAILWVAKNKKTTPEKAGELPSNPSSPENIQKNLDRAREARDDMEARAKEMNRKMTEVDE